MAAHQATEAMERNARLYPGYAVLFNAFFWAPIFFLYFGAHLPVSRVLQLEGIYYAAVVLLEVPSGYLSDTIGRRTTLLSSSLLLLMAYLLFWSASSFGVFAIAQVLLAAGIAFNSGTDTAFHYDSLAALGREDEYAEREAIVARNALIATGLAALCGGAAASLELRYAYGLSALAALASLGCALAFCEPHQRLCERDQRLPAAPTPNFVAQIAGCLRHLRRPGLAWLFGFAVFAVVINHIPYEFYQPYLDVLGARFGLSTHTALAAGAHAAVATFVGAWFARHSARIASRLGTGRTLLLAGAIQLVVIVAMASFLHAAVVLLLLLRGVPSGLYQAPLNAAVTPQIPRQERATYLSIQSLAGRLGFAALLGALSLVGGDVGVDRWPALSALLWIGAAVGGVGLVALGASRRLIGQTD